MDELLRRAAPGGGLQAPDRTQRRPWSARPSLWNPPRPQSASSRLLTYCVRALVVRGPAGGFPPL
ncbi:hypothetical protein EYF80_033058 [Liparis tanakae]|uniref:Uncharacterized protein n=1 Tax=Liparis tanakae TaxID=230148 RepID=A0A4Z2GVE9_9TELE|nr:hypothetical protein EYF80_033058 [Liparis tanakae]